MRIAMYLLPLLALAYDSAIRESQVSAGNCGLHGSAVAGFQLPRVPLIAVEAAVYLQRQQQDLSDYPPLRPVVYLRYDAFPSNQDSQHSADVDEGWTLILVEFLPPVSDWLYIRLDGGLSKGLFMEPAKMLHQWFYYFLVTYTYCPSPAYYLPLDPTGWFSTPLICSNTVLSASSFSLSVSSPSAIPLSTQVLPETGLLSFTITQSEVQPLELIASPDNFLNVPISLLSQYSGEVYYWPIDSNQFTAEVFDPRPGAWFFVLRSVGESRIQCAVEKVPCFFNGVDSLCGGARTKYISDVQWFQSFSYDGIDAEYSASVNGDSPKVQFLFTAFDEDAGRRYATKLFFPYSNSAQMAKKEFYEFLKGSIMLEVARGSPGAPFLSIANCGNDTSHCETYEGSSGLGFFLSLGQIYTGDIYLSVSANSLLPSQSALDFLIGFAYSDCGRDMCHGDLCRSMSNSPQTTYWCNCLRNHSGLDCLSTAVSNAEYVFWVLFLVVSNCAMSAAVWTAAVTLKVFAEGVVFAITMVTSGIYHMCDSQFYCFGAYAPALRLCDFYMSYFSIAVSVIYLAKIQRQEVKFAAVVFYALLLVFCGVLSNFDNVWTEVIAPLSSAVVPLAAWCLFVAKQSKLSMGKWWSWRILYRFLFKSGNFRWRFGIAAIVFFALALTSKGLETNYNYWLVLLTQTHSSWHICIMLTPFFVLRIYTPVTLRQAFALVNQEVAEPRSHELVTAVREYEKPQS